jgi:endonuclease/exonuclease/phosphatase family metal-dependent hydrolase
MLYILTPAKSPIMNRRRLLSTLIFVLTALLLLRVSSAGSAPSSLVSKKTLRIMTYNIHVGVGMDKKLDLKRIADVINRENPDLVGLQEVDRGVKRTEEKDEIAELAKLTRMDFSFAPNLDYQGGQYGVAILSRHLIQKADHQKYENKRETERRGMLRVEVEIDGKKLNFVTTHLDYQFEDGRLFETEQLLRLLDGIAGPLIIAGDFNDEPKGSAYKLMLTRFEDAWIGRKTKGEGLTFPANQPVKRIDYIFTRATDRIRVKKAWVIDSLASDHLPLMAEVEIR